MAHEGDTEGVGDHYYTSGIHWPQITSYWGLLSHGQANGSRGAMDLSSQTPPVDGEEKK